jgi:hypothetical protein
MSQQVSTTIAVMGIDIGKNSFHIVGLDRRGAIALRQRWSRGQVESRLANMPPCLIGMEADARPDHTMGHSRPSGTAATSFCFRTPPKPDIKSSCRSRREVPQPE